MLAGPPRTVEKARKLRRSMSVPKVVLWTRLRLRPVGFKFRRQHPAGNYVLDFFCSEARLGIEVDGIVDDIGERPTGDAAREQWLASQGVGLLRIAAADVSRNADAVIQTIVDACALRATPLHHASPTARLASRLRGCDMPPACRRPPLRPPPRSGEETK